MQANIYKSVLKNLSLLPEEYLVQVNTYLKNLKERISHKEQNRADILSFAGSWATMSDKEFEDFLGKAKESGNDLFGREIEL